MFKMEIQNLSGVEDDARKTKLLGAINFAENVINGSHFQVWFLSQKFMQLETSDPPLTNKSMKELLDMVLVPAKFNYGVIKRHFWQRDTVIGYDDDSGIYTYRDQYDNMSMRGLAGHLSHECMHFLGFSHSFEWCEERDQSQPYLVGNFVEAQPLNPK